MDSTDLANRFTFHPANDDDVKQAHALTRVNCGELADVLNDILPEGREKSLAITNLEQAMFWGNAAIARFGGINALTDPKRKQYGFDCSDQQATLS